MSDENTFDVMDPEPSIADAAMAANAQTALAVEELAVRVEAAERRLRNAWIAIAIVGVLAIGAVGWSVAGRAFFRPGTGAFQGRGMYQQGQFQQQNTQQY